MPRYGDNQCPVCGKSELCRCYVKPPKMLGVRMTYFEVGELTGEGVSLQESIAFMEKLKELGFDVSRNINVEDDMSLGVYTFTQRF